MARTIRDLLLLVLLATGGASYDRRTEHTRGVITDAPSNGGSVILVVSDGLRWQEVFRGADSLLLFGEHGGRGDLTASARKYWRPTLAERREALMPFLWGTLARQGVLLGNRDAGSVMRVTNGMNFSYPGYNEMLVGFPDRRINSNYVGRNPNVTVFEWLNRQPEFAGRVAVVGAWEAFDDIFNRRRSKLVMHTSRSEPLDRRSHAAAMRYMSDLHPRALFVAYVETDDHAHDRRYDKVLDAIHAIDRNLGELWAAAQADPATHGRTTLLLTADHGRGSGKDWTDHGRDVPGAGEIFLAALGPAFPAMGEARGGTSYQQAQVAATVAAAVGLDFRAAVPRAAAAITAVPR